MEAGVHSSRKKQVGQSKTMTGGKIMHLTLEIKLILFEFWCIFIYK